MPGFTEKSLVEDYIVQTLQTPGLRAMAEELFSTLPGTREQHSTYRAGARAAWKFVRADELERESLTEPLLVPSLVRALKRINSGLQIGGRQVQIGDEEIKQVLNELKFQPPGLEGTRRILDFIKKGVPVKLEKEKVVERIRLIDYEHPERNEFVESRQVSFRGKELIRCDVVLFVNGIPLAVIECKDPTNVSTSWENAYKDIKDYEQLVPQLFKYVQIGVACEESARYFPIAPFAEDVQTCEWKESLLKDALSCHAELVSASPLPSDKGILKQSLHGTCFGVQNDRAGVCQQKRKESRPHGKDSLESLTRLLSPETFLDILKNYLFFRIERGKATKVVARYMQYRAAEKVVRRALDCAAGRQEKNKGLIWHWQGSGKTLTMIFAALKLFYSKALEVPSIFFVVDRDELENQLNEEFAALDAPKPEVIDSIDALRKVLRHDDWRGKRDIFITLIHKFRHEQLKEVAAELAAVSRTRETISTRKNVVAFVDEGHRTQYGTLAAEMRDILKNASFFAFTGTPIAKKGRDTYREFSFPPEEKYLDKYFVADSISDEFTKRIVYRPRLEDVHLDKNMLEAFLEAGLEEIPEQFREQVEERIKKRLNPIVVFLENPERIAKKAEDLVGHFKENVDGKFKAMVVAVSRRACVLYKRALDKLLPREYSEIVMTYTDQDERAIADHERELKQRFPAKDAGEINDEIRLRFKEEENPRILIVTEMLLAGFDAPILQTMYLDKPLKEHRLLQAIARTNRPFLGLKEFGLVIDYVGILKDFHRAFEVYSREDIAGTLYEAVSLAEEFAETLAGIARVFKGVPKDRFDRGTMLKAVETLTSCQDGGKKFLEDYRRLRHIFELLGPSEIKVRLFDDFKWVTKVYEYYIKTLRREEGELPQWKRYFTKTLKSVYESTELENLGEEFPEIRFDEDYLKALEEKLKNREEKAANIVFTLNRFVLVDRHRKPAYESIAEKVERLVKAWKERTSDFEKLYSDGVDLFQQIQRSDERQRSLGLSDGEQAVMLALEGKFGEQGNLSDDVRELFGALKDTLFEGWTSQPSARKNIEREVRRFLRKYVREKRISLDELDALSKRIMEALENYAGA